MLYHCNIGFPVVDHGAELAYPAPPGTCVSEAVTERYRELAGPEPGFVEECYEHDMTPDAAGYVSAAVLNRAAGLGVYQRYRKDQLPHHVTWRQLGVGNLRGRHGAEHEPRRGPVRRPGPRRADPPAPWRAAAVRARAWRARRRPGGRGVRADRAGELPVPGAAA